MHFSNLRKSVVKALPILWLGLAITACSPPAEEGPVVFLPKVQNPLGANAEELRSLLCSPDKIQFRDGLLTDENIRNIFQCANYDKSLDGLSGLILNKEFPQFLEHLNSVLGSEATGDLNKTLRDWLEAGADGKSKVDRLLPTLSSLIKNPVFQEALPLVHNILRDGENIWREILPSLADLVHTERFPHTFDDLSALFSSIGDPKKEKAENKNFAKRVKLWAKFLVAPIAEKTVIANILELGDELDNLKLPQTTLPEYLDQMNVKGVFVSFYLESGLYRGERMDPKLNADPDQEEQESGVILTPEQRRQKAYRALFKGGANAPIVQLAGIVEEFNKPHPNFLPSLGRWFSGNGERITNGLFDYIANILIRGAIPKVNIETYLTEAAEKKFGGTNGRIKPEDFEAFLNESFQSPNYDLWLSQSLFRANQEFFGRNNARFLERSMLKQKVLELYKLPALTDFAKTLFTGGRPLPLSSAIKRFSNLHRSDKLLIKWNEKEASLEAHMNDVWLASAKDSIGESVVINYGLKLVQTFFTEFANGFGDKNISISKWYYQSAYGDPSSTESIAGYLFKELSLLDIWSRNKDYLKNEFAVEVFADADDLRAFRYLVDQVPNIWLYIRSGMMRSGNDLTRILSERDTGYLIKNYVDLISTVTANGMLARGVPIYEAYLNLETQEGLTTVSEPVTDSIADRRRIAKGTDALRRVMNVLLEPETEGDYNSTIGHKLLKPFVAMVKKERRQGTERFVHKVSEEIINTPDDTLNRFYREMSAQDGKSKGTDAATLKTVADLLRHKDFPAVIGHLRKFFDDEAVRPALKFLSEKIDDGTLDKILLFIRRILGLKGSI